MKKIFAALFVVGALVLVNFGLADASNWTKYQEPETCYECGGSGHCRTCDGQGYVEEYGKEVDCDDCRGTGNCRVCGGNGEI